MKRGSARSRDDVFDDQDRKAAKERMIAEMTGEVCQLLKERGLTKSEAAKLLGATQAEISKLMLGRPVNPIRLFDFLSILEQGTEKVEVFNLAL